MKSKHVGIRRICVIPEWRVLVPPLSMAGVWSHASSSLIRR